MEEGRNLSLDRLYRSDHERLQRALLAHCGRPQIAADAEQEAFRQALAAKTVIQNHRAWVWAAAFRIANGLLSNTVATVEEIESHCNDSPGELVEFLDMLSSLSDQQRAIVSLRYVGGFASPEIADLLGTSPGSVRVQLHRAHQLLKERLVHS